MILFGIGKWGKWILDTYNDIRWGYCTDNRIDNSRKDFCNIPLITVEELINNHKNAFFVVSLKHHYNEIYAQLDETGFEKTNMPFWKPAKGEERGIYFDTCLGKLHNREIFADMGVRRYDIA